MLSRKAFGTSHTTKSLWLRAEMLFYLHTNQFPLLISTFTHHFYLIGVPTAEVLPVVNMLAEMRQRNHNRRAFMETLVPRVVNWEKIWPTSWHTALVWQALVSMTRSTTAIERMYYQLVQMARSSSAQVEGYSGNNAPPIQAVTQGHFAPFLIFYALRATSPTNPNGKTNAEHVTRIFNDMLQLGISPSEHTLNMLVAAYARSGDSQRVESVLKRMEANINVCEDIPKQRQFPPPSIVTYTSIIQGFIKSRSLQSALAMETRMTQRIQFVEGTNKRTDQVLDSLRRLQREIGNQSGG
jgi:pentatricopeptide repeat protein